MADRTFENWINAYLDYTSGLKSPEIFRRWSAISAVAGSMMRRSYVRLSRQNLYPNLYILLIAEPAVGKSVAIKHARAIMRKVPEIKMTPMRVTKRAFYNILDRSIANVIEGEQELYQHCSLTAMIDEFGVFVKPNDIEFMTDLCDVYDCPDVFDYETSTQGDNKATNVFVNLIGGTTPKYLRDAWTSTVLDEGFPSRVILVFSDRETDVDLFSENDEKAEVLDREYVKALAEDLKIINKIRGRFSWSTDAKLEMEKWFAGGMQPAPQDPRMEHYSKRRHVHLVTLCMIMSAAKRDDMEITRDDLDEARDTLIEAEMAMPRAIEGIGANPIRDQMVLVQKYIAAETRRTGVPVPEYKIRDILINELDPYRVPAMINEMIFANWLTAQGEEPNRLFRLGPVTDDK